MSVLTTALLASVLLLAATAVGAALRVIPWAKDTWRGEVVDRGHWYAMNDKLQHVIGSAFLTLVLLRWTALPAPGVVALTLGAGALVEVVEWVRWTLYWRRFAALARTTSGPAEVEPLPVLCDQPSFFDMLANAAGVLLAVFVL